jgi:hypothetical protein
MSDFPGSPRLFKGGIVVLDPTTHSVERVISLQYNPDSLSRSFQSQGPSGSGDRGETLRLKGPPVETISLEAEIDATDQLEFPEKNKAAVQVGIHEQLAALEMLLYPSSQSLQDAHALASRGTLEIVPAISSLTLFVWGAERIVPMRITEFSITEEAFDTLLNPIRAKVSLGMRVLNINDLPLDSHGGSLYMRYQNKKESRVGTSTSLSTLLGTETL